MSEPYRGRRSGRSAAFPNLWARQSHPGVDRLDPATATTQHFDNRASCFSLDSTSASYQEALLSCPCTRHLTRSSTVFEARPTTHTDRERPLSLWNFHSGNTDCKAYPWEVWSTGAASTSSRWT